MSELLVNTIKKADGTGSLTVPAESGTVVTTASPSLGRRNLIINGAMQVAQRGTSAVDPNATFEYPVDRHKVYAQASGDLTAQQSTDAPSGFKNSLLVTSSAATTPSASDIYIYNYSFEGQDVSSIGFGTASTRDFTLSFYVKSSLTGTFTGTFRNGTTVTHTYGFSYTINSANTWERKTITISQADTSTINFDDDNTAGLSLSLDLGCGSTFQAASTGSWLSGNDLAVTGGIQLIGTNGATWQITGVQLEVGSVATPFEHRSYGEELALCQRYFEKSYDYGTAIGSATGVGNQGVYVYGSSTSVTFIEAGIYGTFRTSKRTAPTVTFYSSTGASGKIRSPSGDINPINPIISENGFFTYGIYSASRNGSLNCQFTADAEL